MAKRQIRCIFSDHFDKLLTKNQIHLRVVKSSNDFSYCLFPLLLFVRRRQANF